MISPEHSLSTYMDALAAGRVSSSELVEASLDAALDSSGEGGTAFLRVYENSARSAAGASDWQRQSGCLPGPLMGLPISIKDLFDVAGETTRAGSVVLAEAAAAAQDCTVVSRLRRAGAVLVGRTNMTEFAFSGLGLNPHYGTPRNPYDRAAGRIPGGSSSGAAVSVSDGMAVAAIGSDTGGSVRIPAALCGLTGFKPTARRVPTHGVLPLSPSLDSIGAIAPTVDCCRRVDAVLAGCEAPRAAGGSIAGVRLGVLQGYVLDDLEGSVASAFANALSILSEAGARVADVHFESLNRIPQCNRMGGFAAAESYTWHRERIERGGHIATGRYDPRVLSRIRRGHAISDSDFQELAASRREIMVDAERVFADTQIWMMPTVPRIAPRIAELENSDEAYYAANTAILRNPSIFNFLDGCAISIPCHRPGEAPVGLMLAARGGQDAFLLRVAVAVEDALARGGCAIQGQRELA